MKRYFILGLLFFIHSSNSGKSVNPNQIVTFPQKISPSLAKDYDVLNDFGTVAQRYGVSQKQFEHFFWKGISESLSFYNTNENDGILVQKIIKEDLATHQDLGYALKRPELCKTNLENANNALQQFSGNWHGVWAGLEVNHLWLPVIQTNTLLTPTLRLQGFQSCFTGDGLGWNYVVENQEQIVILGYVYHFDKDGNLKDENPHYAFCHTNHQLTWVSNDNIYYEFVSENAKNPQEKHYVITGARYAQTENQLTPLSGFQAVYSSQKKVTPLFRELNLNPLKHVEKSFSSALTKALKKLLPF